MNKKKIARLLLDRFKSVIGVFTAKEEDILSIKGIGKKTFETIQKIINEEYN